MQARSLSPELANIAYKELREPLDAHTRDAIVGQLQAELDKAELSTAPWLSRDVFGNCLMFLRWAKFDVQKALKRMKNMAKWMSDPLVGCSVPGTPMAGHDFHNLFESGMIRPLGRQALCGAQLMMVRPGGMDKLSDPHTLLHWHAWYLQHVALHDPQLQVCGMVVLQSFKGFGWLNALRLQGDMHGIMRRSMRFMSECAPYRLKHVLVVHQPTFVTFLMAIMRPFMSAKIKSRMQLLGTNYDRLHTEFVDAADCPPEFGGSCRDHGEEWWTRHVGQLSAPATGSACDAGTAGAAISRTAHGHERIAGARGWRVGEEEGAGSGAEEAAHHLRGDHASTQDSSSAGSSGTHEDVGVGLRPVSEQPLERAPPSYEAALSDPHASTLQPPSYEEALQDAPAPPGWG